MNAFIEHFCHHGNQYRANAGYAAAQSVCTQKQHAADNFFGIRVAGSGAVAQNQISGKSVGHLFWNSNAGKIAETCGDAVCNTFF